MFNIHAIGESGVDCYFGALKFPAFIRAFINE
jgi:hypothetical protein